MRLQVRLRHTISATWPRVLTRLIGVQVTGLPRLLITKSVKAHVQIEAGSLSWRTQGVKWGKGGGIRWDEKIPL